MLCHVQPASHPGCSCATTGADGCGTGFTRQSSSTLASASPATAFVVRVDVRVDPNARGDEGAWVSGLAQQVCLHCVC